MRDYTKLMTAWARRFQRTEGEAKNRWGYHFDQALEAGVLRLSEPREVDCGRFRRWERIVLVVEPSDA